MSGSRVSARNAKGKSKLAVLHEVRLSPQGKAIRFATLVPISPIRADTRMSVSLLQGFGVSSDEDQELSGDDGELSHSIRACALCLTVMLYDQYRPEMTCCHKLV